MTAAGTGILDLFDHPFIRHALLAGTGIGAACGLVGYFVVLRAQVFSGDALSHVAVTGALAAKAKTMAKAKAPKGGATPTTTAAK